MNLELSVGTTVTTSFGEKWTVKEKLGEGSQGCVYLVEKNGTSKALKWYKPKVLKKQFCENIRRNCIKGTPSPGFIWPQDIIEDDNGGFGYTMDLKPDGYVDMKNILSGAAPKLSFKRAVDVSLSIANEMRILHNKGYSYKDLNDGNFFINVEKGKMLICDNDNVTTNGESTGMLGKPGYMAPEIVREDHMPDIYSDRYSMALIIFLLIVMAHPLEGSRSTGRTLTPEFSQILYGTDPVFIFEPDDHRNRPDPEVHRIQLDIWKCLPSYMKDIFIKAFGKEGLMCPIKRPAEGEWIDALVRFRSNIIKCNCGNEIFIDNEKDVICDVCGAKKSIDSWIDLPGYSIPGMQDSRIYRSQTCISDADQALDPVGLVVSAKQDEKRLGLRNMSSTDWDAVTTKGVNRKVKPNEVMPLKDGIRFEVNGTTIQIRGGN